MRMYGYDKIPEVLPQSAPPVSIQSRIFDIEEAARDVFIAMGYDEVITEPITDEPVSALKAIMLENSLTSEKRMLRTTLPVSYTHLDVYKRQSKKI